MSSDLFTPSRFGTTQTLAVTTANTQATLSASSAQNNANALLYNAGTSDCFVRWGNGAQTATTSDLPIPAGAGFSVFKGDAQFFAAICATGSTTLYVVPGNGIATMSAAGVGGSGASSTTVQGTAADGAAVVGNPVRIAGKDGSGNTQDVNTDTLGNVGVGMGTAGTAATNVATVQGISGGVSLPVVGPTASGSAASGAPLPVGVDYNTTAPTFTNGQRAMLQGGSRGSLNVTLFAADSTTSPSASASFSDGQSSPPAGLVVKSYLYAWNGTTNDRVRADTTGLRVQSAVIPGTDRSATLSTASSQLMAANTSRKGFTIINDTAIDIWFNIGATAVATAGGGNIKVAAGARYESGMFVDSVAINVIAASGTPAITAREW